MLQHGFLHLVAQKRIDSTVYTDSKRWLFDQKMSNPSTCPINGARMKYVRIYIYMQQMHMFSIYYHTLYVKLICIYVPFFLAGVAIFHDLAGSLHQ